MAPSRTASRPGNNSEPPASSSEEEESEEENEEEEEEESEEESEGEKAAPTPPPKPTYDKKPSTPPPKSVLDKKSSSKKPESVPSTQQQPSSSESGSGSGSDSESDSELDSSPEKVRRPAGVADPSVKPLASKPMEEKGKEGEAPKTKKPRSKLGVLATPTKSSSGATKRPMENDRDGKDSKRKKKGPDADDNGGKKSADDSKKQLFQRLWSEDDEIAILKGMIEYTAKKGADPSADMNAFHDFIKKSLHVDVTRTQLVDKVRRLKKKYENNVGKGKKGEDRTFSKPHEQKAYELSKKIWGPESNNTGVEQSKANGKTTKNSKAGELLALQNGPKDAEKMELKKYNLGPSPCLREGIKFNKLLGAAGLDEDVLKQGLELIEGAKKSELEEKWQNLHVDELEIYLRRVELIHQQTKLLCEAVKSSKN